jgi:hypothetical protein
MARTDLDEKTPIEWRVALDEPRSFFLSVPENRVFAGVLKTDEKTIYPGEDEDSPISRVRMKPLHALPDRSEERQTPMFSVHHHNFGTVRYFDRYDLAVAFAFKACFEAVIYYQDKKVATFSPISGITESNQKATQRSGK